MNHPTSRPNRPHPSPGNDRGFFMHGGNAMKFALNDHVRVIAQCRLFDRAGVVEVVTPGQDQPYGVAGLAPWHLWFGPNELSLAETPQERP